MNVKTKLSDCLRPLLLGALFLGTAANAAVQSIDKVVAIVDNDVVAQSQLDQRVHEVPGKRSPSVALPCRQPACWSSRCWSA